MHLTEYLEIFCKAKYFQFLEFRTLRGSGLLAGQSSMGIRKPTLVAAGGFNRSRFAKIKPEQILQLSNRIDLAKILNILDN